MEKNTFRLTYEDTILDAVEIISEELNPFGLEIIYVRGGDGYEVYKIKRIEQKE